jgi:pimeloyl-ACP methyl ester carboxylesterase
MRYLLLILISYTSLSHAAFVTKRMEHDVTVNHVRLHCLEQGNGPLVILLHGWPETSYEWRFTMVSLSHKYRVVAPDLRGLGQSEKTPLGYDKKTIATDIKALIETLGEQQAIVIGHDMGGKVAYVMAHLYPENVKKLILVDCTIPGTENADALHGGSWHYGFHMTKDIPEMLTEGREKEYIRAQINHWTIQKDAIDDASISEYVKYYATEGGMTAGFNYYRTLPEDATLAEVFRRQTLSMPVLTISGRQGVADKLPDALISEAPHLEKAILEECGHFVPEEQPYLFNTIIQRFMDSSG